jgi:FixJ family two-component response regulator
MRIQALRGGAVEFLTKPVDDDALLDTVRTALNS